MKQLFEVSYHDTDGVVTGHYEDAGCPDIDDRDTIPCPPTWRSDGSTRVDAGEEQWDREETDGMGI